MKKHLVVTALGVASVASLLVVGVTAWGEARGLVAREGELSVKVGELVSPRQARASVLGLALEREVDVARLDERVSERDEASAIEVGDGAVDGADDLDVAGDEGVDLAGDGEAVVEGKKARPAKGGACPKGMVLVEGDYCPDVRHECKRWLENSGRYKHFRCEEYTKATCLSKQRERRRFCIDRDEYASRGEKLPASHQSWTNAHETCSSLGKRVCLESEWVFACEGEEMRPYPYGWRRDADACNADRVDIYMPDGSLRDLRVGAKDKPRCVSPFGVHNLSGNLEEWTTIDVSAGLWPPRPAMKGAYWQPSRNHCRAAQTAHDRFYKGTETGFRCCADAVK